MAQRPLSDRQQRMLKFIREFVSENGLPPTVRDIGKAVDISSTSVVDYNLRILEREGYLNRLRPPAGSTKKSMSRGIDLPGRRSTPTIPIVGRIAAGQPIDAVADPSDVVEVPQRYVDQGCYALRVRGKSMIEDHIDDGDVVIIQPQSTARDGEIVVALITNGAAPEGEATLKRIYREGERVRLQPANSEMDPIYVDARDVTIQGRVVQVMRSL